MNALPIELLEMVASYFEDIDFFNIRLVNRHLQGQLLPYFSRRYFRVRHHMLGRHSLETLQDITDHPVFCPSLHRLIITPYHLSDQHLVKMQLSESVTVYEDRYLELLAEQNYLKKSGYYAASLATALSKARNCKTIAINDDWDHQTWGLGRFKEQIGIYPNSILETEESLQFLTEMIPIIFTAMATSRTALQMFDLDVRLGKFLPKPSMLQIPEASIINKASLSALHTLGLFLDPPTEADVATWAIDLGRFIMNFDCLEELSLGFDYRLEAQYLKALHEHIHLAKLCILQISALEGGEEELALILLSYKATLREVILDTINLPSLESWRRLLERIRDHLSLTYLELSNCFVDDAYAVILQDETPPIDDSSDHTIRVQGEETMGHLIENLSLRSLEEHN